MAESILRDKSKEFAKQIVFLCRDIKANMKESVLTNQLLRSGTSIGAFLVNKTFLPLLHTGSRILMVTSELAPLDPLPFTGIYAITKTALDRYAYSLRMELQLLGIHVSVLRAGAVKTDMLGVSTRALDRFCDTTSLYNTNAKRFQAIVERVEARCIPPEKIANKAYDILEKRNPSFAYAKNRNPLLLLLNALPKRLQLWIIKKILKTRT